MKLSERLKQRMVDFGEALNDPVGPPRSSLRAVGAVGGAVGDVLDEITPQPIQDATEWVMDKTGVTGLMEAAMGAVPEEYQPDVMAALDATNLAGLGAVATSPLRHQVLSSMKNYIPYHYSPEIQTNPIQKWEMAPGLKQMGVPLQRKVRGGAQWAGENLAHLGENLFDPRARAQLAETGIPRHVSRQLGKGGTSPKDVGVDNAQIQYQNYVDKHSRRNEGLHPAAQELSNRQMMEQPKPWTPGAFKEGMKRWDSKESKLTDADYEYMGDFVERRQQISSQKGKPVMVMKAPRGPGGNHYNDVVYDSPPMVPIKNAFKRLMKDGGEIDVKRLRAELEIEQNKVRNKIKDLPKKEKALKDWFIQDGPEGAVWITGGRVGKRGITEGGIQYMLRVGPDGSLTGIMADTHDFMENVPGVSKVVQDPVVAATPPMHSSVYSLLKSDEAKARRQKVPSVVERKKNWKDAGGQPLFTTPEGKPVHNVTDKMLREAIAGLKPSPSGVLRESGKVAAGSPLLFEMLMADEEQ